MTNLAITVFQVVVLIFVTMVHEVSHGATAYKLGDDTAYKMGRLTLNPFKHLDFFGSFLLPLIFIISGSRFVFGWAKPVLYNPFNLKNPKKGGAIIALAGPLSTLVLGIVFSLLIRIIVSFLDLGSGTFAVSLIILLNVIVFISILHAVFNLMPIPPLDGSKILFSILPDKYFPIQRKLEQYGMFIILLFLFLGGFVPVISITEKIFNFMVGPGRIF